MAPLMGYGRQAFAACDPSPAPTFVCSGDATVNITTQTITYDNANVSTVAGFGVNAAAGNGITVTGEGHLQFTDVNASSIAGPGNAVDVRSTGDDAATNTPGAITIGVNGTLTGGVYGIYADNKGSGDINITVAGAVTGKTADGIYASNDDISGRLTVTTGAQSSITGNDDGIEVEHEGTGNLEITVNGEVTGEGNNGIYASSSNDGDFIITTGVQSVVTGAVNGIATDNHGYGDQEITVDGSVTGLGGNGISASNSSVGGANLKSLKITTGAASIVTGSENGIYASNFGDLNMEITVNGVATGENANGISSENGGDSDTIIKVGTSGLAQGSAAGINALSFFGGQDISITNDGLVRNLSGNTFDLAIKTTGGASTVNNNNLLIGTVSLSGFDDTLNNAGLWNMAGGSSDFGTGLADEVNNSGTLRAADDATTLEVSDIFNIENFNNSGLVTLVDGQAGDSLTIGKAANYTGNNGKLAVDAFLAAGADGLSDTLLISDTALGSTNVVVNLTNPVGSTPNFDGILVITVIAGTEEEDFNLEGGVLNAGFFAWDLRVDGINHELYTTGLGAGSFEFAAGITGAQDIWYQTTGTLLQRQADLRALLAGTQVTPVADFAEPVEPTSAGRVTPGLWFKGVGAYLERDGDEANNVVTDRKQTIWGFLGGFDFGTENLRDQGDTLMFGLFGGYLNSDLDFDSTNTEWQYEGPTVGAYATYLDDAFYADVIVKADFLDVDIDASDIAPGAGDANTDVLNIGGLIDAGYKIGLDGGLFVEPQASLAVVHTEIDDIGDIFGGAVEFDDETSVRGRLGLRLGHELIASNQVIYSSDVTASVWEEFNGDNNATIVAPLFPATGVSDDPGETFGDVAVGFSMAAPEGWSSFIRGNYQFGEDFEAFAGNAGVRYAW